MFEGLDPVLVAREDALGLVTRVRAEIARLTALDAELLVRFAGSEPQVLHAKVELDGTERDIEILDPPVAEIAAELRLSPTSAWHQVDRARLLHGPLARTRMSLAAGRISPAHVSVICEHATRMRLTPTGHDTDPVEFENLCDRLQDRVLPIAERDTPGRTRTAARRTVAVIDAQGETERRSRAKRRRDVYCRPDTDGLGVVIATLSAADAVWVDQLISGLTHDTVAAGKADPDATLGELRRSDLPVTPARTGRRHRCGTGGCRGTGRHRSRHPHRDHPRSPRIHRPRRGTDPHWTGRRPRPPRGPQHTGDDPSPGDRPHDRCAHRPRSHEVPGQ